MVIFILLLLFLLIGLSEIGLAIVPVMLLTGAVLTGIVAFFGMLAGVEGSAQVFLVCLAAVALTIGIVVLIKK
ncbi:hypothetical protein [Rhizobium sp. CECT 9324]|uniref:hypothetical protein n=1 Tax=Rhizobium sp. CECT 9324 TaxID=2845820 RepID=UPI001E5644AE|nr:hypothetical protein [Rhizobium sp. CECT 9324]CAH0343034.1 hypothetical protein RHI9324_04767 [Rhizobium sp. CECT 9324]